MRDPLVTVVVPVWRDADALASLLSSGRLDEVETIVAVPLGEAGRYHELLRHHPSCRLAESARGRATQMNAGAGAATGRWLLFLHADSRLPPHWQSVLRAAENDPRIVGGAFRFALDSGAWQARLLEAGVAARVRLLKLPYGDQGIFVRREVFERLGGYAAIPLMEDVELMRRLHRAGRLLLSEVPVATSARRWERDGWVRRSAANLALASRYLLGASPARLAQRYSGRSRAALLVTARAPWEPGKTRIAARDEQAHAALREALLLDTLDAASTVGDADRLVACEPAGAVPRLQEALGTAWDVFAQRGTSLGERMSLAIEDAFGLGYESAVLIGSDLPDLPGRLLSEALHALEQHRNGVVIGPATDGGYYLIGVNRPQPALFDGIDWGTGRVLEQTLQAARRTALPVTLLERWSDVDSEDDLRQLTARTSGSGAAPRTRAWMARTLEDRRM